MADGVTLTLKPPIEFILRQSGEFRRGLLDLRDLWDRFKPIMAEAETEQFATHGHGAWPDLAASTRRYKTGPDILRETDALYQSLIDPNAAMKTSAQSAEYGTDVEYAHFHQTGGYVSGRPPQRQVIPDPIPTDVRRRLEAAQVAFINDVAARTFGRI